jgi:hypothetical protein
MSLPQSRSGTDPTVLILCVFIMAILSLYWAVLCTVPQNLEALKVAVVGFDGQVEPYIGVQPLVGQEVVRAAEMGPKNPFTSWIHDAKPGQIQQRPKWPCAKRSATSISGLLLSSMLTPQLC